MNIKVTLDVPEHIYKQAEEEAKYEQRPVDEILSNALAQVFPEAAFDLPRLEMERETIAFWDMHHALLKKYNNHYVAIYKGKVVGHDPDQTKLALYILDNYEGKTVLIKRVQKEPEPVLHFRSPRWVEE